MSRTMSRQQRRHLERQNQKAAAKTATRKSYISAVKYYEDGGRMYIPEPQVDLASYRPEPEDDAPLTIWTHRRSEKSDCPTLHGHDIALSLATQPEA